MLYMHESTVGLPVNFQVPPLTELYTVITGKRPTGEWSSLRTDAIHLPHSSDGFQARDERISRRSHHAMAIACTTVRSTELPMLEVTEVQSDAYERRLRQPNSQAIERR